MKDLGLLVLRAVVGGLVAGHGAQKLFGAFGGPGMEGTAGMMEKLGVQPPRFWAQMAGAAELCGGLFTALGFLHPLGPTIMLGPMAVATRKVHWGKPIWVTSGGAELPVTNIAAATTLLIAGPGVLSLDAILGTRASWRTFLLTAVGLAFGLWQTIGPEIQQEVQQVARTSADGREHEQRPIGGWRATPVAAR
jgi:putative oxidoreductase